MSVRGRKTGNRKRCRSRNNRGVVKHFGFDTFFRAFLALWVTASAADGTYRIIATRFEACDRPLHDFKEGEISIRKMEIPPGRLRAMAARCLGRNP